MSTGETQSNMAQAECPAVQDVDSWPKISRIRAVVLSLNLTLAMALNILAAQAVVVALPSIGRDLNIKGNDLQWPINAYTLAFGCMLLLMGRISDLYGHKRVFLSGTISFGIWSIACGFSPTALALDFFRAFQGVSAAAAIPSAMGILAQTFPPGPARSTAFATFSAGAPFGASLGNIAGGALTTYASAGWKAIFYVLAGLAAGIALLGFFMIPQDMRPDVTQDTSVDWIGAAFVTGALVLFTFVLADASSAQKGWASPYIISLLIVSLLLLAAFVYWEHRIETRTTRTPLMRLTLWRRSHFAVIQAMTVFGWSCFTAHQFFATLYYQDYELLSPMAAAIRFLPMAITGLILNFIVGLVAARAPAQLLLAVGALGCLLAPLLFAVAPAHASYWQWQFCPMWLTVMGADITFCVGIMLTSRAAGRDEQALAGGIFNTVTQVGAAIGLAVTNIIKDKVSHSESARLGIAYDPEKLDPRVLLQGLRAAFWGCAAFGMVSLLIALVFMRGMGTAGEKASVADDIAAPALAVEGFDMKPVKSSESTKEV